MRTETLMDTATRFVADTCRTPQSRISTLSTLRQLFNHYPNVGLDRFTAIQLTEFVLAGTPSPNTVKARRSRVMAFLSWCKWQCLINVNPASELKFTAKAGKGGGVRQHTWLSIADYKRLLAFCPETLEGRRARIVLMLGGMLGLRRSEIADLRWSDFVGELPNDGRMTRLCLTGKGGKVAALGVPEQLQHELAAWSLFVPTHCETILPTMRNTSREDLPDWQTPCTQGTVAWIVTNAGEAAGIHLECHDLRRSYAGMLEEMGFGIEDISRMMRHSNIGTTSVYMRSNPARLAKLASGFNLNLGGK